MDLVVKRSSLAYFFHIILVFNLCFAADDNHKNDDNHKFGLSETDFLHSFTKFREYIKTFFDKFSKITFDHFDKIKKIQEKLKKTFYNFFEQVELQKPREIERPNEGKIELQSFDEMVSSDGYKAESHTIVTPDGYILTLHRILAANSSFVGKSGIVLLHHGLLGSSEDWILLGPGKALPYILVNADYEVWIANSRGNKYSKTHTKKNVYNEDFWNFSWHEMGINDLATTIDYIRYRSNQEVQVNFIGHSLGATVLLVLLSTFPYYNRVLKVAMLLAPLAFMHEAKGPLRLVAQFYNKFNFSTLNEMCLQEFMPLQEYSTLLLERFCTGEKKICQNPLLLITGGARELKDNKMTLKIMNYTPGGGSKKTILHYTQLIRSGQFQFFDLGYKENLKRYGSNSPPVYHLEDVTVPIVVFSSSDDWLSTIPDTKILLSKLAKPVMHHIVQSNDFSHTDFVWGKDVHILVYNIIMDILKQSVSV